MHYYNPGFCHELGTNPDSRTATVVFAIKTVFSSILLKNQLATTIQFVNCLVVPIAIGEHEVPDFSPGSEDWAKACPVN